MRPSPAVSVCPRASACLRRQGGRSRKKKNNARFTGYNCSFSSKIILFLLSVYRLINQIIAEGKLYQADGIIDAQFGDQVLPVRLHGAYAQEQFFSDFSIAVLLADQL